MLVVAGLASLTALVYWQLSEHEFLMYDDYGYVVTNFHIQPGITWENIVWAFTQGYVANWHPLTWISHMLDFQLFGFDPAGHHVHNVLLHILVSLLLFLVLERMTGGFWQSAFVAAVFALHPLHVESVAWVSERKDTLSALFWILTMAGYDAYVKKPVAWRYVLVLILFSLGLMAKPMLVTLPLALILLDYWPLRRFSLERGTGRRRIAWNLVLEKVPLLLLSIGSSIITFIVQRQGGAISTLEGLPVTVRLGNAVLSYFRYLGKFLWPTDLAAFYPIGTIGPVVLIVILALVLLAFTVLSIRLRQYPYLSVGWLWYVGTLVPVIGIVQVGAQAMADRYMYLPMIGVLIPLTWGVEEFSRRLPNRVAVLSIVSGVLLGAMALLSNRQAGYWKNTTTLFEHTLSVTTDNWMAHYNLGAAYEQAGELEKARYHYQRTAEIHPGLSTVHYDLGKVLGLLGSHEEAVAHLRKAIEMRPDLERAYLRLGVELVKVGDVPAALPNFRKAYEFNRYYGDPYHNAGLILVEIGKLDEALTCLRRAFEANPDDATMKRDIDRVEEMRKERQRSRGGLPR